MNLTFNLSELWVIHEWVRQDRAAPAYGQEWTTEFEEELQRAIILATTGPSENVSVELTEGAVRQITRQMSINVQHGSTPTGKNILYACFAALSNKEKEDEQPIPTVFSTAWGEDPDAGSAIGESREAALP